MNSYTRAFTYEKPSRLMINTMQSGMSRDKRMIPYLTGPPSIGAPRAGPSSALAIGYAGIQCCVTSGHMQEAFTKRSLH